jgi:hypothetical protein
MTQPENQTGLQRASAADISVYCSLLKLRRTLAHAVVVATSCLPGPWARAAGEVKLTAARFYQRITSNLKGQKSLAPVRTGKSVLSAGVGKEMADIALMVHWHMAGMIRKDRSSWVVPGEPTLSKRRGQVLRRGPFPPRSEPVTPQDHPHSYQPARHSQEPGISSLETLYPGRGRTVLRQFHPYPNVTMFIQWEPPGNDRYKIKAVGARDCRHNSTISSTMKSAVHRDSPPKNQR